MWRCVSQASRLNEVSGPCALNLGPCTSAQEGSLCTERILAEVVDKPAFRKGFFMKWRPIKSYRSIVYDQGGPRMSFEAKHF